ncbi:uncharacterized protein [Littorina saxatilis]|uniref:uncharacterized protein isoform X2 n=1 Tax=Littorina saxatilis TaxID=31220 RepID=UPI0038B462F4
MAEAPSLHQEKRCVTQAVSSTGQAAFCPSCKETYSWVYGEDSMPTSLSCGHTLCIRCAKRQCCSPDSDETSVFCVTCSAEVGITSYRCQPSSQAENNSTTSDNPVESQSGVSASDSDSGVAAQTTPTHLKSASDVAQHSASEGHQACSVVYNASERGTSALSSPMVLDKIQSQDDAWRLLQHDEGFIRDWIVANVPDHVIFKMVGAGNPETVVATSADNSSFILSSSNAVVISSPSNTTESGITTAKAAGITSSGSVPGVSAFLADNSSRTSFEQQFLHYLVNKSSQDRPHDCAEDSGNGDLQEGAGTMEGGVQAGQETRVGNRRRYSSASVTSQRKTASSELLVQRVDPTQPKGVGNKGDCGLQAGKDLQRLGLNRMVRISADGEASQLATTEVETQQFLPPGVRDMATEAAAYGLAASRQSASGLQKQSSAGVYSAPHPGSNASFPPSAQNLQYLQGYPPGFSESAARYASYSRQMSYPGGLKGPGPAPYSSYPFPHPYSLHSQYGLQYTVPHRYGPTHFQRPPQYLSHRGARVARGRGTNFPRTYPRSPLEKPWYSKACSNSLNLSPGPRFSSQPQIRFVQVLRPKQENVWEQSTEANDPETTATEVVPDAPASVETSTAAEQQQKAASEAEIAVMKTRSMPHGTQVEDIYVVPQVWLSGGQSSSPPASPVNSKCLAYPVPPRSKLREPTPGLPAATAVGAPNTIPMASGSFTIKLEQDVAQENEENMPDNVVLPEFAENKKSELDNRELYEEAGSSFVVMSESLQAQKSSAEDSNDYTDFQPVALVTMSKTKLRGEETEELPAAETFLDGPTVVRSAIIAPPATSGSTHTMWEQNEDTPIMKGAGYPGAGNTFNVPPAPVKKMDASILQRHSNLVKFSHYDAATSMPKSTVLTANYIGICNKTVQHTLDSDTARNTMVTAQPGACIDGVEIMESKSTQPSGIMLPKQDTALFPPDRKRLRRNLAPEFYSFGKHRPVMDSSGRGARGGRGRCSHAGYHPYSMNHDGHQPPMYPYNSPFSFDPRRYLYDDQGPMLHSSLRYRNAPPATAPFLQDRSSQEPAHMCQNATHSLVSRGPAVPINYHPREPYPDVLSHLTSGQGDYTNMSGAEEEQSARYSYFQDSKNPYGRNPGYACKPGGGARQGGVTSKLPFWPFRQERESSEEVKDQAMEYWKIGATGHKIRADDMETVQWLHQEVVELSKQIPNDVLANLQGCLALLERNAYSENKASPPHTVPQGREVSDMDHLLRCVLSLGQVVVHYGWWCRPHYWDHSSDRWGEMALLASQVFEDSLQRLNKITTFYLDHVCEAKSSKAEAGEGSIPEDGNEACSDGDGIEEPSGPVAEEGEVQEFEEQVQYSQLHYTLPDGQPEACTVIISQSEPWASDHDSQSECYATVDQSECYTTLDDQSESYHTAADQSESYTQGTDQSEADAIVSEQINLHEIIEDHAEPHTVEVDSSKVCTVTSSHFHSACEDRSKYMQTAQSQSQDAYPDETSIQPEERIGEIEQHEISEETYFTSDVGQSVVMYSVEPQSNMDPSSGDRSDVLEPGNNLPRGPLGQGVLTGPEDEGQEEATTQTPEGYSASGVRGYADYRPAYATASVQEESVDDSYKQELPDSRSPADNAHIAQVQSCVEAGNVTTESPCENHQGTEVYYTAEGVLDMSIAPSLQNANTTRELHPEHRICEEQSALHVPLGAPEEAWNHHAHVEESNHAASTETLEDAPRVAEDAPDVCLDQTVANQLANIAMASSDIPGETTHVTDYQPETTEHVQDNSEPANASMHISEGPEDAGRSVITSETVSQSQESEDSLHPPADPEDRVTCSGEDMISDSAIMMSEVEVETDETVVAGGNEASDPCDVSGGTVVAGGKEDGNPGHVSDGTLVDGGVKGSDSCHASLSRGDSHGKKGNMDTDGSAGKRKRSKTSQARWKHMKHEAENVKSSQKKSSSTKAEKWNLRSSRPSASETRHSPRNASRKL